MNLPALLVTVVLLLGNAFFVASEFAVIASRSTAVQAIGAGARRKGWTLSAMRRIPLMVAGAQLGVTICSLGLGAAAEPAIAQLLEHPFGWAGVPATLVHPIAFVLALAVVAYLHTVIGEMVPKNLTLVGPERAVLWLGPPMLLFCLVTRPLLAAMQWASRHILGLFRIQAPDEDRTVYTADELAGMVAESRSEGLLEPSEHDRLTGALALTRRTAADTMRPWSSVYTVPHDISSASLELMATRTGRSRFPVVDRPTRRVVGFVHVKDVMTLTGAARRAPLPPDAVRPLAVVPPDRTLADLLIAMRRDRMHIVLVARDPNEAGGAGPLGIITLDDVLAAVVGRAPEPAPTRPHAATGPAPSRRPAGPR